MTDAQAIIVAAIIAAIPSSLAAWAAFSAGKSSIEHSIETGTADLVPLGVLFSVNPNTGKPRARMVPRTENESLLGKAFALSQMRIQIVTVTGSSWLLANHLRRFEEAMKRVDVEVLMFDFANDKLYELVQHAMIENEKGTLKKTHYAQYLRQYSSYLYSENRFTLGVHRQFPWTRFTIFDDKAVSFIITPAITGGPSAQAYYTEDPLLVRCFKELFEQTQEQSTIFKNKKDALSYADEYGGE